MLRELARDYQLHLIIALPVIWFIVFKYLPMYGAQIAFREFAAAKGIWGSPWVGLDHFKRFFESYLFWRIVGNTFFLSIYTLAATFPIPILLALSINNANNRMFRKAVQMIIYARAWHGRWRRAGIYPVLRALSQHRATGGHLPG